MTPHEALRSAGGRGSQPERLAHPAVLRADTGLADPLARRRSAPPRHRLFRALPARVLAAERSDRAADPRDQRATALLPRRARRPRRTRLRDAEVPHPARG